MEMILKEEYEFVRSAVFTNPDDQSGRFYHFWLLDQTVKVDMPTLVSSWPPHGSDINQVTLPFFSILMNQLKIIPHEEVNSSKNVQVKDSMDMSDSIISLSDVTSSRPGLLDLLNDVLSEFLKRFQLLKPDISPSQCIPTHRMTLHLKSKVFFLLLIWYHDEAAVA
ncbi:hypothetical protein Tco_1467873 [Tanacetum coccineum]